MSPKKTILENNEIITDNLKIKYFEKGYWDGVPRDKLYWAGIDFEKFYQNIRLQVIKENILKYSLKDGPDEDFEFLIEKLLTFPLDLSGWTPIELKKIGLDNSDFFLGVPTGLFIAGFLTNIALLQVDNEITQLLNKNKNIAHFRFVDDHVILSYDFNSLTNWVKEYKKILDKFQTGVKYNFEKIEPKEFSDYVLDTEKRGIKKSELKKSYKIAYKATTLDPKFPSPLMTQTLAKVSAISKTDFDLLSEGEESQLIADLVHLLITDFPDQELRKDTRISFAATMLSRIIPKKRYDYSQIYLLKKNLLNKGESLKKGLNKLNDSESNIIDEISGHVSSILFDYDNIDLLFDENSLLKYSKIEVFKQFADDCIKTNNQIFILKTKIRNESDQLNRYIFNLLLKSVKENHQKVRLWVRIMEFCYKTGFCPFDEIILTIEKLNQDKISDKLSTGFLYSLFISTLSEKLFWAISTLLSNKNLSRSEKTIISNFLKSSLNAKFLTTIFRKSSFDKKEYYKNSFTVFKATLGSILFVLESDPNILGEIDSKKIIQKFGLLNFGQSPKSWAKKSTHNLNSWLYWIFSKTHNKSEIEPYPFWEHLIKHIDFNDKSFVSLLIPFPSSEEILMLYKRKKSIVANLPFLIPNEGWFFEMVRNDFNKYHNQSFSKNLKKRFPNLHKNLTLKSKNNFTVFDWINWTRVVSIKPSEKSNNQFHIHFDPRLSEWTALEIIIQMIESINLQNSIQHFFKILDFQFNKPIHPANFILPKYWTSEENESLDWDSWRNVIKQKKIFLRSPGELIQDYRYTPDSLVKFTDSTLSIINGLATILLNLITRENKLPWIWNTMDQKLVWSNIISQKLQNSHISSYTCSILISSLSNKNRETYLWENKKIKVDGFIPADDTLKDPPMINNLEMMLTYLKRSQKILETYQINVQNNMPRQLIPISLELLSNENNRFMES
jgi:hypothetical protein